MEPNMADRLGEYLQNLRHAKGLTTRKLGSLAHCNHSFISRLESGERLPSLDRLWQLIEVLEGDFGQALFLLCLDSGVPEGTAQKATQWVEVGTP
jgi:transcriptional regulator with XRE-family HTH domain